MKNSIILLLCACIVGLFLYYNRSIFMGEKSKDVEKKEATEARTNLQRKAELMSALDSYSSSEIISLLSIKYSLSADKLIEVISEYNNQSQLDYSFNTFDPTEINNKMKSDINALNIKLNAIADKYKIQSTTLINILIDYKSLKNSNK